MAVAAVASRPDREPWWCSSSPRHDIRPKGAILPVLVGLKSFPCASAFWAGGETMGTRGAPFVGERNIRKPYLDRERRQVML